MVRREQSESSGYPARKGGRRRTGNSGQDIDSPASETDLRIAEAAQARRRQSGTVDGHVLAEAQQELTGSVVTENASNLDPTKEDGTHLIRHNKPEITDSKVQKKQEKYSKELNLESALDWIEKRKQKILKRIIKEGLTENERKEKEIPHVEVPPHDEPRIKRLGKKEQNVLWEAVKRANDEIDNLIETWFEENTLKPLNPKEQQARDNLARGGADIVVDQLGGPDKLKLNLYKEVDGKMVAMSKEEADRVFEDKMKELWRLFAVHGRLEKENGKWKLKNFSDLDGKTSMWLLAKAGINKDGFNQALRGVQDNDETKTGVKYIIPGQSVEGRINLDTSDQEGVTVVKDEAGNVRYYSIDHHHPDKSKKGSSATKYTYEMLVGLGLLDEMPYLNRMVKFVTDIDSGNFPEDFFEHYFEKSWKTVAGLQRFMRPRDLEDFFKRLKANPFSDELSDEDLVGYHLKEKGKKDQSEVQKKNVEESKKALEKMESDGFIIDSDKYGKIGIDVERKVKDGYLAARAFGCDVFVSWNPENGSFMISSKASLGEKFSNGRGVREVMWIKPPHDESPLTITLGEILEKMTDGKLNATGKLKEYLDKEKEERESAERAGLVGGDWEGFTGRIMEQLDQASGSAGEASQENTIDQNSAVEKEPTEKELEVLVKVAQEYWGMLDEEYTKAGLLDGYSERRKKEYLRVKMAKLLEDKIKEFYQEIEPDRAENLADEILDKIKL